MIRAVLDANTIVSGMVRFRTGTSPPAVILRAWVDGPFELLVSDHILDEVVRTLEKPYFRDQVTCEVHDEVLDALVNTATPVDVTREVSGVATHPEDDLVLSAVVSSAADVLVTGDKQLQRIRRLQSTRIISPADFCEMLHLKAV